ncbi:DUF5680 domain-containing protein [Rhizobium sp. SL42]|uniref:DUF5680 domain-containing protein n=1 Tax=Rhizobium sp. SL42 TaxID=2806346 RepID=UPI001F1DA2ED|nr:DUF5680 domain-containing protein [Rhizobium sp. SL42]UJW74487.1 hypothetical protein IM739_16725 [Rhizobium sp. SL42]
MRELEQFIIEAKAACYAGGGSHARVPCRTRSHDILHERNEFRYMDSYFGGTDFLGQEVVWIDDEPVWAMNYYGRITEPMLLCSTRAGTIIKSALTALYREGRFLGGFSFQHADGEYIDESVGDHRGFRGIERILVNDRLAYQLDYQGGIIKP